MKAIDGITLETVQHVYDGPEGQLWELIMGEQIHIGGLASSMDLAQQAGISGGRGVDLCCCNGAGMRFLLRFCGVEHMTGVDATHTVVDSGRQRCSDEGFDRQVEFVLADVCDSGLSGGELDFVWGEDAWCYVLDKPKLIAEAARLVKAGGTIAFTDWIEGPAGLTDGEAARYMTFMKFPNVQDLGGYQGLLTDAGCEIVAAADTGRFAPYVDLYLDMLGKQLTYDALKIIGFDQEMMQGLAGEMAFMQQLAHAGKIAQGLFVAKKL